MPHMPHNRPKNPGYFGVATRARPLRIDKKKKGKQQTNKTIQNKHGATRTGGKRIARLVLSIASCVCKMPETIPPHQSRTLSPAQARATLLAYCHILFYLETEKKKKNSPPEGNLKINSRPVPKGKQKKKKKETCSQSDNTKNQGQLAKNGKLQKRQNKKNCRGANSAVLRAAASITGK